jgi:hypothetical protein
VVTWRSILAVGAITFTAGPALAQQLGALYPDLSHPDGMPDPYSGIHNKAGIDCCNGHDCRRVLDELDFVIKMEGGYILKETGEFIAEFQVGNSPDKHWHICRGISYELKTNRHDKIRCLLIPPGGV